MTVIEQNIIQSSFLHNTSKEITIKETIIQSYMNHQQVALLTYQPIYNYLQQLHYLTSSRFTFCRLSQII